MINQDGVTGPESLPGWGRLLIVLACVGVVGMVLLATAFFLWPWISAFS